MTQDSRASSSPDQSPAKHDVGVVAPRSPDRMVFRPRGCPASPVPCDAATAAGPPSFSNVVDWRPTIESRGLLLGKPSDLARHVVNHDWSSAATPAQTVGMRRSSQANPPLLFAQVSPWIFTGSRIRGTPAASWRGRWNRVTNQVPRVWFRQYCPTSTPHFVQATPAQAFQARRSAASTFAGSASDCSASRVKYSTA